MGIVIKYSSREVELEAPTELLRELSLAIRAAVGLRTFALPPCPHPAAPYQGFAKSLTIEPSAGAICVSRNGEDVVLSGSREDLLVLANNIEFLAAKPALSPTPKIPDHLHIEYYPGSTYVKKESIPLIVTRRDSVE
ncbi:MAG TPA: hypothetical protein VMC02_11530 [Steroidobacteraceae bacterium]|nr:hypothetical protein [Steroidobacteraceae bacterium]